MGQNTSKYSISGQVVDSVSMQPIEYASVAIYKLADASLASGAITNSKGEFSINNLVTGKLFIKISCIGYKNKTVNIEIFNSSVHLSEPILLNSSSVYLDAIQVNGRLNERQINIEKTKINVSQNISSLSGNITDVLRSQSTISIDSDNKISLRGNSNILVLLDGQPTTATALNSVPASGVESVDIVTNPDVKQDAEGTGGIINIITRNKNSGGLNGVIVLNTDFSRRLNGGLNQNFRESIWNLNLNYNGKYEKAVILSNLSRQLYAQPVYTEQEINSSQSTPNHTASFQLSAKPGNNLFSLGMKLMFPDIYNSQDIISRNVNDTLSLFPFSRRNEVTFSRKVFESSFGYKKIFRKNENEISFDGFYSRTKGSRPAEYYIMNEMLQKSDGGGTPTNITLKTDYLKSIFSGGKLELGLKAFSRWNDFNYNFYDLNKISNQWIANASFSNDLEHKEYIYSAYAMYSDSLTREMFYKIGFRLEYSTSQLKQKSIDYQLNTDYLFPFPYLMIKYNLDKTQEAGLSINRRISRPTYPQLNPFVTVIDQATFETGNKYLIPEISDKFEIYHSFTNDKFQISSSLYFSTTKDFITQVSLLSEPDKLNLTYVNGRRQNKIGGDFDGKISFGRMLTVNPGLSVFYTKSTGNYDGIDLNASSLAWTGNINTVLKLEQETEMQVLLNYNSPVKLSQFSLSEIYYADLSVKRSFYDNKLAVSLTLSDIFNTRKWIVNSENKIFRLYNSSKNDTRIFWIGLTYNINSILPSSSKNEGAESDGSVIRLGQ
jgi:outer membrane receptor protein involved in Fe transport